MAVRRRRISLAISVALLASAIISYPVGASLSLPDPLEFWDGNDDGVPSGEPIMDHDGPYWSSSHKLRLDEAIAEWSGDTQYDPTQGDSAHNIFVDGRVSRCYGSWYPPEGGGVYLALTCRDRQLRNNFGDPYYRLTDVDIYFNMEVSSSPGWWVGAAKPAEKTRFDFGGILTHELGHTVLLKDLYGECDGRGNATDWYTMCGSYGAPNDNNDSFWSRSLHADDEESANVIY